MEVWVKVEVEMKVESEVDSFLVSSSRQHLETEDHLRIDTWARAHRITLPFRFACCKKG